MLLILPPFLVASPPVGGCGLCRCADIMPSSVYSACPMWYILSSRYTFHHGELPEEDVDGFNGSTLLLCFYYVEFIFCELSFRVVALLCEHVTDLSFAYFTQRILAHWVADKNMVSMYGRWNVLRSPSLASSSVRSYLGGGAPEVFGYSY